MLLTQTSKFFLIFILGWQTAFAAEKTTLTFSDGKNTVAKYFSKDQSITFDWIHWQITIRPIEARADSTRIYFEARSNGEKTPRIAILTIDQNNKAIAYFTQGASSESDLSVEAERLEGH